MSGDDSAVNLFGIDDECVNISAQTYSTLVGALDILLTHYLELPFTTVSLLFSILSKRNH